jgi:hypothetical protein
MADKKVYYKPLKQEFELPEIDAQDAVDRFPDDYAFEPWPDEPGKKEPPKPKAEG